MTKVTISVKEDTLRFFQENIDDSEKPEVLLSKMIELLKELLIASSYENA